MKKLFDRCYSVLILFFMISLSCCYYSTVEAGNYKLNVVKDKMEKQESKNQKPLIIHGEVKSINRLNIDKSGRNPKYQVSIYLDPTSIEGSPMGLDSNSLLRFRGRETEILGQIDRLPIVADNLVIESFFDQQNTGILPIKSIKFK